MPCFHQENHYSPGRIHKCANVPSFSPSAEMALQREKEPDSDQVDVVPWIIFCRRMKVSTVSCDLTPSRDQEWTHRVMFPFLAENRVTPVWRRYRGQLILLLP